MMVETSFPLGTQEFRTRFVPSILVIEDDEDTRNLLFDTLTEEGYQVDEAGNGLEAWKILQNRVPDLILMDIMMPALDGYELCKKIRGEEQLKSLPIIILTAKDDFNDKMEGFQAGSDDYITKPFILSEVLARIKVHLRIRELQKNLTISGKRYRLLVENSPDGILSISPDRELIFHNSRFIEILRGHSTEPLTGRILQNLFPISDLFREISLIMDQLIAHHGNTSRETQISTSNRSMMFLEINGMPVTNENGTIESYLMVVRDITQRRKMEEALIQAEKINSLGILTAGIAHEVNNPLTCISNAVQLLKKTDMAAGRKDELCDLVLDNVNRIVKIIKDLHIFSKPHGSASAGFSVGDAISETLSLVSYQIKKGRIDVEFCRKADNLLIFGDKNHFQQVMVNLLVNAIQAISDRGKITVTLDQKDHQALISVEDTGCGISPDQLGQIFNPFFTTKREWKGTGLGLAVSYRIIQLFRGTINVHTQVGKGTRFSIAIPLYKPGPPK
jgi:PAS domain S-box-containing protein